ncbi:MAG TPA: hypothetical protein VF622_07990 [Segetibacter sp.]
MRKFMKFPLKLFLITTFFLLQQASTNAQNSLPLADKVDEWSEPQVRFIAGEGTPKIKVRSKLIKHYGFTGVFEIEITNLSKQTLSSTFALKTTKGDLNDNKIHINNSYQLNLKPDYKATYKMEFKGMRAKRCKEEG